MAVLRRPPSRAPGTDDRGVGDPRVVLVTGTTSGFGRAIATELARRGHRVYGTSRHPVAAVSDYPTLPLEITDDSSAAGYRSAVHGERASRALEVQERYERQGPPPERVGRLVADLVDRRRLRPRYLAGATVQRLQVRMRPLFPAEWYEHLVSTSVAAR